MSEFENGLRRGFASVDIPASDAARDRIALLARSTVTKAPIEPSRWSGWIPQAGIASTVLVLVATLTPPGRAAADWVAQQVGISDDPTLTQRDVIPGTPVAIYRGSLSDGDQFEVVAKQGDIAAALNRPEGSLPAGLETPPLCLAIDWPSVGVGGDGGMCIKASDADRSGDGDFESLAVLPEPRRGDTDAGLTLLADGSNRPAVLLGFTRSSAATDARVVVIDPGGVERDLDAAFVPLQGDALANVRLGASVKVLAAPISADLTTAALHGQVRIDAVLLGENGKSLARKAVLSQLDLRTLRIYEEILRHNAERAARAHAKGRADR